MKRNLRKTISMILAMIMCCAVPVQAIAAETSTGTVDVETTAGNKEPVDVTITIEKTDNGDGTTTTNTTTEAAGNVTESGMIVDYNGSSSTVTDGSGNIISGTENTGYSAVNGSGTYGADGGSESETEKTDKAPNATVDVPLTAGDSNSASDSAPSQPGVTGDAPENTQDGTYDYTSTKVESGSVTVETTEVTVTNNNTVGEDLEGIHAEVVPDADNNLLWEKEPSRAPADYLPGNVFVSDPEPDADDDTNGDGYYEYIYIGTGNTSQLWPAVAFTEPLTEEEIIEKFGEGKAYIKESDYYANKFLQYLPEGTAAKDENGKYIRDEEDFVLDNNGNRILKAEQTVVGPDGKTYYLHRIDLLAGSHYVEGWYKDGEWVEPLNGDDKYGVIYAVAQQFIMKGKETGNPITAYCADIETHTISGYEYKMENLEDADYYTEEQAKMIRSVALNGYWGTKDDPATTEAELGSLEAMKEKLRSAVDENGARIFTDEEINALTDGVALSATQMAIWSFSNHMVGTEFVNAQYVEKEKLTETGIYQSLKSGYAALNNVPEDMEDDANLMFKIYEYLISLDPTEKVENTTANTVITADNFIKDLSVTVLGKDENHDNNKDNRADNDAYVTNLSFALVVTPSEREGDTMLVTVIKDGKVLAKGRITGELQAGEVKLVRDENGNYTFPNITLVEGEQNFNITLSGVQNLEQGVYLYTSEIKDEKSSQTLVGIAEGTHAMDVSMNISFNLSVDDEIVTRERVWRTEWKEPESDNPPPPSNPPREQVPPPPSYTTTVRKTNTSIIPDEDVPLADSVETGDASFVFAGIAIAAALGLAVVNLLGRKAKEN